MKNINLKNIGCLYIVAAMLLLAACSDDDDNSLKNDLLRKDSGPVLVGNTLEFAYAIGSTDRSFIKSVEVTASISGDTGTGIATHSRYTNPDNGNEEYVLIATETNTEGAVSSAYLVDTIAATIRYFYVVPEEARGKTVRFDFRSQNGGNEVSISSPEYKVSNVDIFKGLSLISGDKSCFSLETMKSYTVAEVESLGIAEKIDFIYTYKPTLGSGWTFGHGLVAPSNDKGYLYPIEVPIGAKNKTQMDRRLWPDGQLKTSGVPTIYVDEIDLREATVDKSMTHAYELGQDQGVLIRSANGKYAAYLYLNGSSSNAQRIDFAIKRLAL